MLGTDDVAIIYHISSTAADGWLAGDSDTASSRKGSRQCTRRLVRDYQRFQRLGGEAVVARRALQTAACHRAITEHEAALDASDLGRSRCRCRCRRPAGLWRASRYLREVPYSSSDCGKPVSTIYCRRQQSRCAQRVRAGGIPARRVGL